MRLFKHLKKNNGSTLTLVLFMLFLLSVTAIAVITLTGSELSMSVMSSDRSKALQVAQAGAEKAAQVIDEAVAQAQEDARVISSKVVQDKIAKFKDRTETISGTKFENVLELSDVNEIKILNEQGLNDIYKSEYKFQFNELINNWVDAQKVTDAQWNALKSHSINGETVGKFRYISADKKHSVLVSEKVKSIDGDEEAPTTYIKITSIGEYKSPSNGSTYKRTIEAEFGLFTDTITDGAGNTTSEIPISYGKLTKVRVNKKPTLLFDKALIAQKNIISVDGLVDVIGDMVCFGTIPTKVVGDNTVIDYDADSYKFGGIMAGMVPDDNPNYTLNYKSDVWSNSNFVKAGTNLKTNIQNTLGYIDFPDNYFTVNHSGSFHIKGNAGTLAYLHSLYSSDVTNMTSKITVDALTGNTITGNTFARSVMVESESNYSETQLKNVYTYDDLRIDGNNSKVKIGECNDDGPIDSTVEGSLVGLNTGNDTNPISSAVIVAGESDLYIHGSVYVGGSTFYNEYKNTNALSTDYGKPYLSGMSIQKSDSRPAEAFERSAIDSANPENDPANVFYLYENDPSNSNYKKYSYVTNTNMKWEKYNKPVAVDGTIPSVDMMTGQTEVGLPEEPFGILDKAMHLKNIWDNFWKLEPQYSSYFNTGDIIISTTGGKIKGFCYGGVAANGTIYGPFEGFTEGNTAYKTKVDGDLINSGGKKDYARLMNLFIDETNTSELNLAHPTKNLADSVNKVSTLTPNIPYLTSSNTFMYYGDGNVVLTDSSVGSNTELTKVNGYLKGIVYSAGDIYVRAGTKYKGVLIAEGNIVFLGDADIKYDQDVVDNLIIDKPEVGRFFKHTASDLIMNDPNAIVQTIKKAVVKNIKVISWKEI